MATRLYLSALGVALLCVFISNWTPCRTRDPAYDTLEGGRSEENTEYQTQALRILQSVPLIDGHDDLPLVLRENLKNRIYSERFLSGFESGSLATHNDLGKMKRGRVGGQFWSVFVPCPKDSILSTYPTNMAAQSRIDEDRNSDVGGRKVRSSTLTCLRLMQWAVRDTLEQVDVVKRLIAEYPTDLAFCSDASCVRDTHKTGRIANMIGVEGGHQTGNSLGVLRQFFDLGVRYMTVTHNCDNAYATAAYTSNATGSDPGLTRYGLDLIREMNRIGMMVDLAHVSYMTMVDVLRVARAPVIFSHSGAYAVTPHYRNVPDDVLRMVKKNRGIVMIPCMSLFVQNSTSKKTTIDDVVDHLLHVARVAGWDSVGFGSDFDGALDVSEGCEV